MARANLILLTKHFWQAVKGAGEPLFRMLLSQVRQSSKGRIGTEVEAMESEEGLEAERFRRRTRLCPDPRGYCV